MKNTLLSSVILVFIVITGCSGRKSIRVEGIVSNPSKKYISLVLVDVNIPVLIDSARIGSNGRFSFKVDAEEPNFYQVGFSNSDFVTILAEPGEKLTIKFPGKRLADNYIVEGSPGTLKLMTLDSALAVTKTRTDSLRAEFRKYAGTAESARMESALNEEFVRILKEQRMFNIGFILRNLNSMASIKAIYQKSDENTYVLYDSRDLQYMKLVSDTLSKYYPGSKNVRALKANFEKEYNQMMLNKIGELSKNIEPTELNPSLKDISGNTVTLSSLRGKYVLLTFWSVASQDCITENLQLKDLYRKYKARGFEIYQINLDTDAEAWKRAVKYDELPWVSVREDDPLNPKNAILFNVRILPANYLFNREGGIEASNLHGKQLELKLSQIFGN